MSYKKILSPLVLLLCVTLISCSKKDGDSHNKESNSHEDRHAKHDDSEGEAEDGEEDEQHVHHNSKSKKDMVHNDDDQGHDDHSKVSRKKKSKKRKLASEDHINAHEKVPTNVAPEQAFKYLVNGNTRYLSKSFPNKEKRSLLRDDGISQADRSRMVSKQKPHSIILSCSDSRVPPEVIFDQKLGEIFVVRTAGESLDQSVIASIEYAVDHLGASLLLVMGHESCGAVNASLEYLKDRRECDKNHSAKQCDSINGLSPALESLVKEISPRVEKFVSKKDKSEEYKSFSQSLKVESKENAVGVALKLLKESNIIKSNVESGRLDIRTAIYSLRNGKVDFFSKIEP